MSEMTPKEMGEKIKVIYKQVDELLAETQDDADSSAMTIIETLDTAGFKVVKAEDLQEIQQTIRDLVMVTAFKVITFAMTIDERNIKTDSIN